MKLKIYFSLLISFVFSGIATSQEKSEMEVIYSIKYIPDSLDRERKMEDHHLVLLFNDHASVFFSQEAKDYYNHLIKGIATMQNGQLSLGVLPPFPRFRSSVYKNGDAITATLPVGKYLYSFEQPQLEWTLLQDEKTINNIPCHLAKTITDTGDTFFAWYSTDYPFPEGPFRFKGLPGLIVKIYNLNKTIEIEASDIRKNVSAIEPFNVGSIKIKDKNTYLKARAEYIENPNIQNMNTHIIIKKDGVVLDPAARMKKIRVNVFLD